MILLAAVLVLAGCVSLALSQSRNWALVSPQVLCSQTQILARRLGWSSLLVALVLCVMAEGAGFAALLWPLLFAVQSLLVVLTLSFCPRVCKPVVALYLQIQARRRAGTG